MSNPRPDGKGRCNSNNGCNNGGAVARYPSGYPNKLPAIPEGPCGARSKRTGKPCLSNAVYMNGRCRFHGGLSTGPRTEAGKQVARENGKKGGRPRKEETAGLERKPNHLDGAENYKATPKSSVVVQVDTNPENAKRCLCRCVERQEFNPNPPGQIKDGSSTDLVLRYLRDVAPRWSSHEQIVAGTGCKPKSVGWALHSLRSLGVVECRRCNNLD